MTKFTKEMLQWVKEQMNEDFELVTNVFRCDEYIEVDGKMGGDYRTIRYYWNGRAYEK
jgi:hypothetical protein